MEKHDTTLVLTRKPNALFQNPLFSKQFGRFGTLIVLQGAKVTKVRISPGSGSAAGSGAISVPTGVLDVTTSDGAESTRLSATPPSKGCMVTSN